jgi:alpha-beta hydrolase superfamily lysophospholipase
VQSIDMQVDVTDAVGLAEPAHISLTVTAPDLLPTDPIVCFAKPGAGYSRGYYTTDLPGPAHGVGSQAEWHAAQGWIVVAIDHLGVGDSSQHDPEALTFTRVVDASQAAETDVRQKLAAGTLTDGLGPVEHPVTIGLGQSMGGALSIVQQGRYHCYDGLGVLGFSPLRTLPPTAPGSPPLSLPWFPRDTLPSDGVITNALALAEAAGNGAGAFDAAAAARAAEGVPEAAREVINSMAWGFHYDDVDSDVVRRDMDDYPARHGDLPSWGSATVPLTVALWCTSPGSVFTEAAAIRSPVLVALGERDVLVDPRGELRAYESSSSVDYFVCPKMAHMHNFAGTRELFWRRIETWAAWVRACRLAAGGANSAGRGPAA